MTDDQIVPVAMPKWGLSMRLGKITAWAVAEGDDVAVGDDLADVETDKITGTVEASQAGTVRRIVAQVGEDVPVSGTIALIAPAGVSETDLDCLKRFADRVTQTGELDQADLDAVDAEVAALIDEAVADAKGLMIQAIRDNDPVIFFEHKALYDTSGPVPEESYALPFGEANVVREGGDVTIVTLGRMVHTSLEAAAQLAGDGVQCEIVDLRTTSPLDEDTVLESVESTGRLVVVDEAHPRCSIATDISALAARKAFGSLQAPIEMVTAPHTPVPFSPVLEDLYIPTSEAIAAAASKTLGRTVAR